MVVNKIYSRLKINVVSNKRLQNCQGKNIYIDIWAATFFSPTANQPPIFIYQSRITIYSTYICTLCDYKKLYLVRSELLQLLYRPWKLHIIDYFAFLVLPSHHIEKNVKKPLSTRLPKYICSCPRLKYKVVFLMNLSHTGLRYWVFVTAKDSFFFP